MVVPLSIVMLALSIHTEPPSAEQKAVERAVYTSPKYHASFIDCMQLYQEPDAHDHDRCEEHAYKHAEGSIVIDELDKDAIVIN